MNIYQIIFAVLLLALANLPMLWIRNRDSLYYSDAAEFIVLGTYALDAVILAGFGGFMVTRIFSYLGALS